MSETTARAVPVVLTVGVTGHRGLEEETLLGERVRDALLDAKERFGAERLTVVSALAEGADRLVAREALEQAGASLEAILPLDSSDYCEDFETDASQHEFRALVARAARVTVVPRSETRPEAYERAGRAIVDSCDVLIALWDGKPSKGRGGTAEIVEYATQHCVPQIRISTDGTARVKELGLPSPSATSESAPELDAYRNTRVTADKLRRQQGWWIPKDSSRFSRLPLTTACNWVLDDFVRADHLAGRYQKRYEYFSVAVFVFPAVAVLIVTFQTLFWPEVPRLAILEVIAMLALLGILSYSHRAHVHSRWISFRYLAERLRSAYFLALAGTGDQRTPRASLAYISDPSEEWIQRALSNVTAKRPAISIDENDVEQLRTYLAEHWIEDQARYHCRASRRHRTRDDWLRRFTVAFFTITLGAAFTHTLLSPPEHDHHTTFGLWVIAISIAIPAAGAALHGFGAQREYKRHCERYGRMVQLLRGLRRQMQAAPDLATIRSIAAETERIVRDENSDWFGVTRFHDVELIA